MGDLKPWNLKDLSRRFCSGKTGALHDAHRLTGDRIWSSFPFVRPMATIAADTVDWFGFGSFGGFVHDVIGTRRDPHTGRVLSGVTITIAAIRT